MNLCGELIWGTFMNLCEELPWTVFFTKLFDLRALIGLSSMFQAISWCHLLKLFSLPIFPSLSLHPLLLSLSFLSLSLPPSRRSSIRKRVQLCLWTNAKQCNCSIRRRLRIECKGLQEPLRTGQSIVRQSDAYHHQILRTLWYVGSCLQTYMECGQLFTKKLTYGNDENREEIQREPRSSRQLDDAEDFCD